MMLRLQNKKLLSVLVLAIFLFSTLGISSGLGFDSETGETSIDFSELFDDGLNTQSSHITTPLDPSDDLGSILDQLGADNNNTYNQVWDPWLTRAAIHAVATFEDWMALASGYLYDNQVHLYRWNYQTDEYDLVSEVGGGVFQSDVMDLEFADTNHNDLMEIIAVSEEGRFYVFEQKHLFDPETNTENIFELVYSSDRMGRIFDLVVRDMDGDFKKDIVVGTADVVRFYEYDDHSGYPFNQEHWISYEETFSISTTDALVNYTGVDHEYAVTSLTFADANTNGLPEIVVGTRAGVIFLLENNGTVIDVEGTPFPVLQDDSYEFIWSSGNTIQRDITDMESGDLDLDGNIEVLIAVQGQGAYILDYIEGEFGTYRIQRDYVDWEVDPAGAYPFDNYVDWILNSSDLVSIDGSIEEFNADNFTYTTDYTVYTDYDGTNASMHGNYHDPMSYDVVNQLPDIYPYLSAMAQAPDGMFTYFNALNRKAWAILDFAKDEEASGNGIDSLYDLEILTKNYSFEPNIEWTLEFSQDGFNWTAVNMTRDVTFVQGSPNDIYQVEVDPVLNSNGWDYYRYIRINLTSGSLGIDAIHTRYFNKPIYDAQSVAMGEMTLKGESFPRKVGYIGTVDGAILAVFWNQTSTNYEIVWDSWEAERYKLNKNIFDLAVTNRASTFPAWLDRGGSDYGIELTTLVPDMFTYEVENFYDYRNSPSLDFVYVGADDTLYFATQSNPYAVPAIDDTLTTQMFATDEYGLANPTYGIPGSVQSWIASQVDADYFSISIVPMVTELDTSDTTAFYDTASGYWMFVGKWDGEIEPESRQLDTIDMSIWYFHNDPGTGDSTFIPVHNSLNSSLPEFQTLITSEKSGQMPSILGTSQWVPKIDGYDVLGSSNQDLILTNGKVHLLETTQIITPTPGVGDTEDMYGDLNTLARPDYFKTINEDEKGRIWTNAEGIDFDQDGDMDLMLGFARYDSTYFTYLDKDKVSYGFTYFENEGSAEEPVWVEKKKAVTNNDEDSNFRVERYTEPNFAYTEYDFGDVDFDTTFGYHPAYRTSRPNRLFMFQPDDPADLLNGRIKQFRATYYHPTSLLAATYPEAKRLDINMQHRLDYPQAINYGFHIFETWSNEDQLRDWTLTLDTGDLDQDGNNEVIVGDFNNNAYVFEHLSNNTFKRAYKTFDIHRNTTTNKSPYAHELFDGIEGTFNQTIFDHVEYLIAGVDLNNNTLQEFIAATKDMLFVFESVITPGGYIRPDTFELVKMIDLLAVPAVGGLEADDRQITAISVANDATLDGRKEIVIALGPALLIYEVGNDTRDLENHYNVEEVFYRNTGHLQGLYRMPGNHYFFPDLLINSLLVEDIDQDGLVDIIMAGADRDTARPIRDGFIYSIQWNGVDYSINFDSTLITNTTSYNVINTMMSDDQDYDGFRELIIGHDEGIDIYEFQEPGYAELQEVLTSNPHYQLPTRAYHLGPQVSAGTCNTAYAARLCIPQTQGPTSMNGEKDVLRFSSFYSNYLYMLSAATYGTTQSVILSGSTDNGLTLFGSNTLTSQSDKSAGITFVNYENPVMAETPDGVVYFVWVNRQWDSLNGYYRLYLEWKVYDPNTFGWSDLNSIYWVIDYPDDGLQKMNPVVFPLYNQAEYAGFAFQFPRATDSYVQFRLMQKNSTSLPTATTFRYPYANGSGVSSQFTFDSFDIVQLDYDVESKLDRQNYGMVFSGYQNNESLTFDYDLFYSPFTVNTADMNITFTRPTRMHYSGIREKYPSIIQERHTGNILVTYEAPTLRPFGGLFSLWSDNDGLSWNGPYDMSHPLGLDPKGMNLGLELQVYPSDSRESFRVGTSLGPLYLDYFNPYRPVIAPGTQRGYSMIYTVDLSLNTPRDPKQSRYCGTQYTESLSSFQTLSSTVPECAVVQVDLQRLVTAYNPWSNFSWYHHGGVTDIDTGDSDHDGRREILAASGKQAFLFEYESNNASYILHTEEWSSRSYQRDITDVALGDINGNGFEEIVISSDRGIVNAFEVANLEVNTTDITPAPLVDHADPIIGGEVDPFIYLGSDFTSRTDFILYDINSDSVDDVIVVDDYFIGASDTYQLRYNETYNEVEWSHDIPEWGKYLGEYLIFDHNQDGTDELVVVFEKYVGALNIETGEFLWKNGYLRQNDVDDKIKNPELSTIVTGTDRYVLLASDFVSIGDGKLRGTLMKIAKDGTQNYFAWTQNYSVVDLKTADLTGDGKVEHIVVYRHETNLLDHWIEIYPADPAGNADVLIEGPVYGLPPITEVATGNFDRTIPGDEMTFFIDFAALGHLWGYDFTIFPTIYWTFGFNETTNNIILPNISFFGISPFSGLTKDYFIADFNNDGYDDFIGEGNGGLFSLTNSTTGIIIDDLTGTFSTSGVPYANHSSLVGDFCGPLSIVTVTSANRIGCYQSLNFTSEPSLGWASQPIDFDIIDELVPGSLDTDGKADDIMVIGRNGYVYIYDNTFGEASVDDSSLLRATLEENNQSILQNPWIITALSGLFLGVIVTGIVYRREIFLKLSN